MTSKPNPWAVSISSINSSGVPKREYIYLNPCDNAFELRKGIDNEIPERKYENNKLLIRTHKAA